MSVIEIENLTKDYGRGRGIFGVNLTINQGEIGYDFVDIGVFSLVSSIFIDERIGEDAKEPCATIRAFFVGIEAVVSLDEGILDEVFGFHLVVCVFERHAIEG